MKKEIREWVFIAGLIGVLWVTGWYKDVAGWLQRGLLETGMSQPDKVENPDMASYAFTLTDASGKAIPFENFRGEVVFMNIWATWCPPCIAEMPDIHDLYQKKKEEVSFVMISVDENPDKARSFLKRKGYDFPLYFLNGPLPAPYRSKSIPTTFVLSPNGQVIIRQAGMAQYDTEWFRELLSGLAVDQMPS